ncbi:MAG: VCBS repeat-containing protein, partial [Planctomycetes bacterium]|nr:VCBS repeat-containing protein [Planctomycetota bacterium]
MFSALLVFVLFNKSSSLNPRMLITDVDIISKAFDIFLQSSSKTSFKEVIVEDINSDGLSDVFVNLKGSSKVMYGYGDPIEIFKWDGRHTDIDTEIQIHQLIDVNGDDKKDSIQIAEDKIYVFANQNGDLMGPPLIITVNEVSKITDFTRIDVDKDGTTDFLIVVGNSKSDPKKGAIVAYTLPLTVNPVASIITNNVPIRAMDTPIGWLPISAGEIPGLTVLFANNEIKQYAPNEKVITNLINPTVTFDMYHFNTFDFNNDGKMDHYVTSIHNVEVDFGKLNVDHSLVIHGQNANGTFTALPAIQLPDNTYTTVTGDYDSDGDRDIVVVINKVTEIAGEKIYGFDYKALTNNGNGTFSNPEDLDPDPEEAKKKAIAVLKQAGAFGMYPAREETPFVDAELKQLAVKFEKLDLYPLFKAQLTQLLNLEMTISASIPSKIPGVSQDLNQATQTFLDTIENGRVFVCEFSSDKVGWTNHDNLGNPNIFLSKQFINNLTGGIEVGKEIQTLMTADHESCHAHFNVDEPDAPKINASFMDYLIKDVLQLQSPAGSIFVEGLISEIDYFFSTNGTYQALCKMYLESTKASCGGQKDYDNEKAAELAKEANKILEKIGKKIKIVELVDPKSISCDPKKITIEFKI